MSDVWREHWESLAFENSNGRPRDVYDSIIADDIRKKLDLKSSDMILNVGCGTGIFEKAFSNYCTISMDFARVMVSRANMKFGIVADATVFPIRPLSVTKICVYSVLQYLSPTSVGQMLDQISLSLQEGGICLIGDVELRSISPKLFLRRLASRILLRKRFFYHDAEFLSRELKERNLEYQFEKQFSDLPYSNKRIDIIVLKPRSQLA